jgi:hypothetical protein
VIGGGWADADEKAAVRNVVRLMGVAHNAEAVSFISEAWVAVVAKRDDESREAYDRRIEAVNASGVEAVPGREEVIMVSTTWRQDGALRTALATAAIERDAEGRAIGAVDRLTEETGMEGPMARLLLPYEPGAEMREHALDYLKTIAVDGALIQH